MHARNKLAACHNASTSTHRYEENNNDTNATKEDYFSGLGTSGSQLAPTNARLA